MRYLCPSDRDRRRVPLAVGRVRCRSVAALAYSVYYLDLISVTCYPHQTDNRGAGSVCGTTRFAGVPVRVPPWTLLFSVLATCLAFSVRRSSAGTIECEGRGEGAVRTCSEANDTYYLGKLTRALFRNLVCHVLHLRLGHRSDHRGAHHSRRDRIDTNLSHMHTGQRQHSS